MANNNGGPDWSSLPSDVLSKMASNLLPLPDYIHFRAVCKSWCNSIPPLAMPSPLLFFPTKNTLTFCSFVSPQTTFHSPALPGLTEAHCVGSHDGWLAMCCSPALNTFLINPFTGHRIDLPSFDDDDGPVVSGISIIKIVFNSGPTPKNLMVVALVKCEGVAIVCYARARASEDGWDCFDGILFVEDVLYYNGGFLAINRHGVLFGFNLRGRGPPKVKIIFKLSDSFYLVLKGRMYLAVGSAGNIILVSRDETSRKYLAKRIDVLEFIGFGFKRPHLVWSLGGQSLFVGINNGFSVPAEESPLMRSNCIYLIDFLHKARNEVFDMGFFDMREQRFELMFPRNSKFDWCQAKPVWLKPRLKRNNCKSTSTR